MARIIDLATLAKTSIDNNDYFVISNTTSSSSKKVNVAGLFPALVTAGTGGENIWSSITNKNQLNFKGIKSGDTGLLTVGTTDNNIVLTPLEAGIDLSLCNNTTSSFMNGVDFTGSITGENAVVNGGTGLSTISKGAMLYASADNTIAATTAMSTNGQILIGNATTGIPTLATLTGGTNVTVTNTAGAISIASSLAVGSAILDLANYNIDLGTGYISADGATSQGLRVTGAHGYIGTASAYHNSDVLNLGGGGIRFADDSNVVIKPNATTSTTAGKKITIIGGASASAAAGDLELSGGTASGSGAGGSIVITGGRDTSGSSDGNIQLKTYAASASTAGLTVATQADSPAAVDVTVNTGNLVITNALKGIVHIGIVAATQGTNATTAVVINSTSGIITLYGAALASQAEVEFTFTNSTIQADSVILTGLEVVASGRTAGANIQVYFHTKATGSCKIVVVNIDDVATDDADIFKINYLVINNNS